MLVQLHASMEEPVMFGCGVRAAGGTLVRYGQWMSPAAITVAAPAGVTGCAVCVARHACTAQGCRYGWWLLGGGGSVH